MEVHARGRKLSSKVPKPKVFSTARHQFPFLGNLPAQAPSGSCAQGPSRRRPLQQARGDIPVKQSPIASLTSEGAVPSAEAPALQESCNFHIQLSEVRENDASKSATGPKELTLAFSQEGAESLKGISQDHCLEVLSRVAGRTSPA